MVRTDHAGPERDRGVRRRFARAATLFVAGTAAGYAVYAGVIVLVAVGLASCSGAPEGPGASAPGEQAFAVFTRRQVVIDRLGVPVAPPVTVGSTPSPQTLRSDAPEIVEVDASGELIGRRDGRTLIRSLSDGQALEVEVRTASALAVAPAEATLTPGGTQQLKLFAGAGGEEVPAGAADWATSNPDVAAVVGGRVEAGRRRGTATVTARYAGTIATARIAVAEEPGPAFTIRPQAPRLRVGDSVTFEALSRGGPLEALWSLKGARLMAQSGPRTFVALSPGTSKVCGEAGGRVACASVIVFGP